MQVTRLIAVRHGQTAWNVDTRIQGQLDIALNTHGQWQAQRVGRALADEGLHHIYSSDLQRALATARTIARHARMPQVHLHTGLRERRFGHFEGQTYADIEARWPQKFDTISLRFQVFLPGGPMNSSTYGDFLAEGGV